MVKYNGVIASLVFPSGDTMENIPVSVKEFKTGTKGYFAQRKFKHFHALFFAALVVAGTHGEKTVLGTKQDIYKEHT